MLFSVEQAFVGREEIRAPLKTPAWEAMSGVNNTGFIQIFGSKIQDFFQTQGYQIGTLKKTEGTRLLS